MTIKHKTRREACLPTPPKPLSCLPFRPPSAMADPPATADVPPSQTVYASNLPERLKKDGERDAEANNATWPCAAVNFWFGVVAAPPDPPTRPDLGAAGKLFAQRPCGRRRREGTSA